MRIIARIQIKQGETVVCIVLQYKCFIAFKRYFSDFWVIGFILCCMLFSLALNSGSFFLNSSHCYERSFIWELLKKFSYGHQEFDFWKQMNIILHFHHNFLRIQPVTQSLSWLHYHFYNLCPACFICSLVGSDTVPASSQKICLGGKLNVLLTVHHSISV
jgi:hypothetical protein